MAVDSTKLKIRVGEGKVVAKISIRGEDYMEFLEVVMKVLNANNMGRRTLEMYNVVIYKIDELQDTIFQKGFDIHPFFFCPLYNTFLIPTEEFWAKLEASVKRNLRYHRRQS
ncbi:hypothetical protein INT45_010046 [Circinella minor]|uniref:Uncharacterized protein n=1 Tax=Circinella minor TaxID=1195481 RepID=A0A8H7VLV1_9FUNG|nr:hypothetical protein INT45_010046 [Circinella minor]